MERQESEQSILLATTELSGLSKEPQPSFVDPSLLVSPTPSQSGQSSLPELGPELIPIDASHLFADSPLFNANSPLMPQFSAATEPYQVASGMDSLTGLSLDKSPAFSDLATHQSPAFADKANADTLLNAETSTKDLLRSFFKQPDWQQTFQDIFGNNFDRNRAEGLATAFAEGDFSALPTIEILPESVLNGARGGFDTAAGKIYLSDALLNGTPDNATLVKSVLIEEIGHFIDAQINRTDTAGDEGEYFADKVQGIALSEVDLLKVKTEDDHSTIWLNGSLHQIEQATTLPNFAIRTQGRLKMNGGGDLDGDPLNLQDDALVYAAKGFTINGSATLPVQYNANGTPKRDASGKLLLVANALTVATGYTSSTGPSSTYAGVNPPAVISPQTIDIPLYTDLLSQTLKSRVPSGTPEVIFNALTPLNSASDWATKFPAGGTATRPKVVHVINGGLNIPPNAVLNNLVIKVDNGSINFNGSGHTLNNVMLVASKGSINLNNANATSLAVFASGSINANGNAQFAGKNLFATGTTSGSVSFSGSTKTVASTDQLQVIAWGNIILNGSSDTRGSFLSAGTITFNGSSTLYGSIAAKGDITFNGSTTVIWVPINPMNQAPTNLTLSSSITPENVAAGVVIGTLSTTDPNANNTFTYSLVTGTGSTDNAAFTITGNQLKINASPNFEAKSSYSILVRTIDQGGLSYDKALTISITDVNEAPTSLVLSTNVTPENVAAGSVIGTLTSTDPDANNTFTYSLVTGTGSTDNAAFSVVGNQLKINASPDFETKSSYSVRVRTTDQGGLNYEHTFAIAVTDVNEAPISLVLSNNVTPENVAAGSVIGTFTSTDPDASNTFTYSLVSGAGSTDNTAFSVVGNQLKINASPDFETKSSYSVRVRTTDQGGLSSEKALSISILNVNEAPTSIALTNTSLPENSVTGTILGQLSTVDPDLGDTQQYTLTDTAGDRFEIIGNTLRVKAGAVLDFETTPSLSIEVQSTDAGGLSVTQRFAIALTNVNEAPTNIALSATSIPENSPIGTIVGTLSAPDPDQNDTQQYSLVTGTGSTDNAAFKIVGNQLQLQTTPNFATHPSYSIRVKATDAGGLSTEKVLSLTVLDTTAPLIQAGLAHDTAPNGQTNTDTLTSDPSIQGQVTDNGTIAQLKAWFDGQTPAQAQSIQSSSNGQFQLSRTQLETIYGRLLSDGQYTLNLQAVDLAGNASSLAIHFTLDTAAPAIAGFNLAPGSDTAPTGDFKTKQSVVNLVGQSEPNAQVKLINTGTVINVDGTGQFQFTNIPLTLGDNPLAIQVTDAAGNTQTLTQTFTRVNGGDVVTDWNAIALEAIRTDRTAPPRAAYILAMVQTTVFDTVDAIDQKYDVFKIDATAAPNASPEAAAIAAAHRILVHYFPHQQPVLDLAYTQSLAKLQDSTSKNDGIALGESVADQMLALRANDGTEAVVAETPSTDLGKWRPTLPKYDGAALPQWPDVQTFALVDGAQFRPSGPPTLDSAQYAADYNLTKDLGAKNSTTRTADQTQIAKFWADGAGTYTPPGHWNQIAQTAAANSGNSLIDNARLFALLDVSLADSGIAAWDAKYDYNSWRPITAIQQGDADGNALTAGDPTWTPLLATPPFPEYVSGHSTFSGAASTILTNAFGSNYSFTTTSYGLAGITRSFTSFDQAADQAGMSRIYGGIHFNSANQDGLALGRNVGSYVTSHYFQPVNRSTVLQATLANDTAPVGTTNRDKVTSDPTITGKVTGTSVVLNAGLDQTTPTNYQNITAFLAPDGSFTLNAAALAQLNGSALQDGIHTVHFQAFNAQGSVLESQDLAFVLDRGTPSATFEAPTVNATYSPTAHLKGKIVDTLSQGGAVRYSIDGQAYQQFKADASGQFDQIISPTGLGVGNHQVAVEIYDAAGNMSQSAIAFTVSDQFSEGGPLTTGWGTQTVDTLTLYEGNSFEVQKVTPVAVGVSAGTRTLEFDVNPNWDLKDIDAVAPDRLLVYLVNPSNPSQTLLDGGEAGTALFSLSGTQAEYRPGLVRFDGRHVSIDVSSLPVGTTGNLVFQLLNLDGDTGSSVQVLNLTNTVDPTGTPSPIFPVMNQRSIAGPSIALDSYLSNPDAKVLLSNVHLDPSTGRLLADLRVQNTGTATISSNMVVLFPNLPSGVSLLNASGTHPAGSSYLNLKPALVDGDLKAGATSGAIQVVLNDPNLIQFDLQTVVLTGALTQPPQLQNLGTLNVTAGGRLEVPLTATSLDGGLVTLSLRDANNLPTGQLANGKLTFTPSPTDVGTYHFTLVATSNGLETTQVVTLNVAADPVTTTRVSGVVQNTDQMPLAGILVDVDGWQAVTDAQGRFTVELQGVPTSNNLRILGGLSTGSDYPSIAEKLPLLLEHDVYSGVNNDIARPIYLPKLDYANGQIVDSFHDAVVTSAKIPGASVTVKAGTLTDQSGNPFTGVLSITEVPTNLTPAALPGNLHPDLVVTIQPGDMKFTTPAPLTLPNRAGYAPGQIMDLWSINPTSGVFEIVGKCQVSADGSVINTIEGGIRNSSWHFPAPPPVPGNPAANPRNPTHPGNPKKPMDDCGCDPQSQDKSIPINSNADLQSGAVEETHDLVSHQSLGITRGLSLHYDSLRADPRPIVHFGFSNINSLNTPGNQGQKRLLATLNVKRGNFTYNIPGADAGQYGLKGGENIWFIPDDVFGAVDAALQIDLSSLPSGQYDYTVVSGIRIFAQDQFLGTSSTSTDKLISVNSVDSVFGSGWGLSGLQTLVENDDRSILLIDGNGIEQVFQAPVNIGDPYIAPPGNFSRLVRLSDGTFRLTEKDQTVSTFNAQNQLIQVEDSNHNQTRYIYNTDGNLSQVVDPAGLITTLSYTGNRVSTITDPTGLITQMNYDAAGNLLSITDPDGAKNTWEYDDKHHMTAHTNSQGERGTDSYDFAGRVSGAVRKDGSVVMIQPVAVQGLYRPDQTIDPLLPPPVFQLGAPISSQVDGNGNISNALLDQAGQAVSVSDAIGTLSTVVRDSKNQVIQETDGNGNSKYYYYDANGNMTIMKDDFAAGVTAPQSIPLPDNTLFSNPIYSQLSPPITADLDGDGNLDLISSDAYNSHLVSILFGDGKGHYSGSTNIYVNSPNKLFVSDINQDHHLDIVTTSWDGTQINFLLNDGQRHFTSTTLSNPFSYQDGISSVSLSDLNGDGAPDLALTATVYSGGGYGSFAAFSAASFGINTVSAFAAPSAPSNATYKVITLLNQGNGTFAPKIEYVVSQSADSVLAVDLNNDLKTDLIALNSNQNSVSVLLSQGDGTFASNTTYNSGTLSAQVLYADLNRDGYIDLVTAGNYGNQYSVLLNNGDGTFAAAQDYTISGTVSKIFLEDINNDGSSDLLIEDSANKNILVSLNQGNGTFGSQTSYAVDGTPGTILLGDVNSDQQLDLVVSSSIYSQNSFYPDTKLTVFLNDGVNGFISPAQYDIPTFESVQLQDFNNDGKSDLLGRDWRYGNSILMRGNGDGSFNVNPSLDLPALNFSTGPVATPHALAIGLLDNDNIPDIVYTNYDRGSRYDRNYISLSLSATSPNNPLQDYYFTGNGPTAIAIGDINSDGHNDLAVANGVDNTISVLLNNGNGNFTPSQTYAVGALPQDLAFGDLNQDGLLDLVVTDSNGNEVSVLFNQGNGTFANAVSVSAGRNPYALAVGDINHDGLLDIVTANYLGGFSTLTNQGNGTFVTDVYAGVGYTTTIPYGIGGTSIALDDIDKDGALDVVTTHSNANDHNTQTSVWLNQGNGSFGSSTDYTVGLNPQAVAIGDIDKDGNLDIVTVNSGDGSATVLLGSGTGTFDPFLRQDFAIGGYAGSLALADLDKDGYLDFVTQNFKKDPSSNQIYSSLFPTSFFNSSAGRSNLYVGHNYHNSYSGTLNQPQDRTVGDYVRYTYDPIFNKVISKTDELGHQMLYKLDPITGNIVSQRQIVGLPGGADDLITRYTYTAQGQTDLEIDPLGHITDNDYDTQGRLIKVTTAKGTSDQAVQQFEYDASGNRIAMIDENGNRTTYVYDSLNRLVQEIKADPDGNGPLTSPITRYEYDAEGNQTAVTDSRGYTTHYEYDALDRATNTTNALGAVTSNEYDRAGNLVATTDELGRRTQYRYDSRNRKIESIDPEGGRTQYLYDANNNQIAEIDALGRRTNSVYDARNRLIRKTDPLNGSTTYLYDAIGNLIVQTDPNGHQTKFTYDDLNRRIKTTDALGNIETSSYDKDGNLIAKTDALGQTTTFTYDNRNRMIATVNALGGRTSMTYDGVGNLLSRTDELNRTTTYRYDALNRQISVTDPLGHTTSYTYDSQGNRIAVTDALNRSTTYTYDALNRQVGMTDALGGTKTMAYDAVGNLIAQTDELNRTSIFSYDVLNRQASVTDPLGYSTSYRYDLVGNRVSTTDALNRSTTYTYDALNRQVGMTDALGGTKTMAYDAIGNLIAKTDELNRTSTFTYDVLNRQISAADPLGHTTSTTYNSVGNRVAVTDALNRSTTYTYDALNRQVGMTDALGGTKIMAYDAVGNLIAQTDELNRTSTFNYDSRNLLTATIDPLNHTSTRTYDAVGNLLTTADALGHITSYGYDALNRKVSTTDALGKTTLLTYDDAGNLLSLTDPDQNTTTYTYDSLNRQLTDTNQLGLTRTYTYNAVGNETSMVDRNGRKTVYAYDALNRQTQENWLDASGNSIRTTNRSYDAASQLASVSDPDSHYSYTYDLAGRLTSVDNTGTSGVPIVVLGYTYDAVNNKLTTTDTINGQLKGAETYTYDALNRNTRITQSGNGVSDKRVEMTYDVASQRTNIARYSDLLGIQSVANSDYSYDLAGRLTRLTHKRDSMTYTDYQWTYDAADRITQFVSPDGTSNYSYDNRDQLTGTDHSYQSDEAYSYNANGNRTNSGYQTGTNNQLLSNGIYSYTYDNEGNRTSRSNIATGEVTQYVWDYRNRLTSVITQDSSGTVTKSVSYTCDAYNRRIAKVIDSDGAGSATPQTERMVYDGDNIALTFGGNGTQTHRYLFGPGVDQILADETQTSMNWALVDNQGTVRDVIDSNGVVLNHLVYDSYGQVTSETDPSAEFRYGYTGRERDTETGLNYNRARYFEPLIGRFISEDPIQFKAGDANLYRYVFNNSTNFIDPSGNQIFKLPIGPITPTIPRGDELQKAGDTLKEGFDKSSKDWARGIARELNTKYRGWRDVLPPCPCTEDNAKKSSDFKPDENPDLQSFHPGADSSYRSKPRDFRINGELISKPGQQCTYKKNKLITSGPGAGTPDFSSPEADKIKHVYYDVLTWKALGVGEYLQTWRPDQGIRK